MRTKTVRRVTSESSKVSRARSLVALLAAATLLSCGGDGGPIEPPTIEAVAGNYEASRFTTTEGTRTTNWLVQGASIELNLTEQGTTGGQLFIPEGGEGGADLDADLTGTWTLLADTVRLSHAADTFLRDMEFLVRGSRLEALEELPELTIRVTLQKL